MAYVLTHSGLLLSGRECARLYGPFLRALHDMRVRDGGVPDELMHLAADIRSCAEEYRESVLVKAGSGTALVEITDLGALSISTERLTVQEAARLTGLSDGYLRRLARGGVVTATRSGGRGGWLLDGGSLAAWMATRDDREAA